MYSLSKRIAVALFSAALLTIAATAQNIPPELISYPDLIVYNGKIMQMNEPSLANTVGSTVQAMAIRNDRIQFMGTNDDVLKYAGPQTKKIDLKGRTVIPGMIDTHSHMHDHTVQLWTKRHPEEVEKV